MDARNLECHQQEDLCNIRPQTRARVLNKEGTPAIAGMSTVEGRVDSSSRHNRNNIINNKSSILQQQKRQGRQRYKQKWNSFFFIENSKRWYEGLATSRITNRLKRNKKRSKKFEAHQEKRKKGQVFSLQPSTRKCNGSRFAAKRKTFLQRNRRGTLILTKTLCSDPQVLSLWIQLQILTFTRIYDKNMSCESWCFHVAGR